MELLMKNYKPSEIHHLTKAGKMSGSEIQGFVNAIDAFSGIFVFTLSWYARKTSSLLFLGTR